MRYLILFFILATFLALACERETPSSHKNPEPSVPVKVIVEKEKQERERPIPPEVKIRLKRDGKNHYSWELSGTDVDQILRVDDKLKKKLGEESSK